MAEAISMKENNVRSGTAEFPIHYTWQNVVRYRDGLAHHRRDINSVAGKRLAELPR